LPHLRDVDLRGVSEQAAEESHGVVVEARGGDGTNNSVA
jgi:hypothetical protein